MKKFKFTPLPFMMSLMLALAVSCEKSSDLEPEADVDVEAYTYSVVFQVIEFSDPYFDMGTVTLSYLNAEGESVSIEIQKESIPGQVTVPNLSAGDVYSFDVKFDRAETLPTLSEISYTFSHEHDAYSERSDGQITPLTFSIMPTSITIPVANLEAYVDSKTGNNIISFSGTI